MMKRAAILASLLVTASAASAFADDTQTTNAGTVIVVTPSAPVILPQQPTAAPGAVAQTSPVPAPTAPPQNEDWNNVSHINGTVVPVGERNRYLYQFRKTQISVDPISAMFGAYDFDIAHALSQNVAVNGSVMAWSMDHGEHTGYQLTASVPIYFRRTFSGPFIEPGLIVRESTTDYSASCSSANYGYCDGGDTHRWAGPEMLFGWQSTFDSGLTVKAAFGFAKHMASNEMEYNDDSPDVNGYFRVGYAF